MELSGNLSDFALSDILQILALSRKTGIVLVENGSVQGRIALENGRVVFACSSDQQLLAERIILQSGIDIDSLDSLKKIAISQGDCWTFKDLIVESGLLTSEDMNQIVRDQIFGSVAKLVSIEKGRFGIALREFEDGMGEEVKLDEGIEINEVLLEVAKKKDEDALDDSAGCLNLVVMKTEYASDNVEDSKSFMKSFAEESSAARVWNGEEMGHDIKAYESSHQRVLLYSFLSELRVLSYESEVVLTVMRFCSEFASRGILFCLSGDEFKAIGKFGVDDGGNVRAGEEAIRSLRIRVSESSVFKEITLKGRAVVNCPENDIGLIQVRTILGGKVNGLEAFLIPLVVKGKGIYAVYGDNYPGETFLDNLDTVITFINQASLTMEKINLEGMLATRENSLSSD